MQKQILFLTTIYPFPDLSLLNTTSVCHFLQKISQILNIKKTRETLSKWLSSSFGFINAELHYAKIEPCIIIEEYLSNKNSENLY